MKPCFKDIEEVMKEVKSMESEMDISHTDYSIEKIIEDALHLDKILEYDEENEFENSN